MFYSHKYGILFVVDPQGKNVMFQYLSQGFPRICVLEVLGMQIAILCVCTRFFLSINYFMQNNCLMKNMKMNVMKLMKNVLTCAEFWGVLENYAH